MAYRDIILASNPLAYWPMTDYGNPLFDDSGNDVPMVVDGTLNVAWIVLVEEGSFACYISGDGAGMPRIEHDDLPGLVAFECWIYNEGDPTDPEYIQFNGQISGTDVRRIVLAHEGSQYLNWYNAAMGGHQSHTTQTTRASLAYKATHFLVQYDSTAGETHVYIGGVKDSGLTLGYDALTPDAAGRRILVGGYFAGNNPSSRFANTKYLGHIAAYDHLLTQQEIDDRIAVGTPPDPGWNAHRSRLTWANQETPGQAAPDLAPVADIGFRTNGPVPNLPITGRLRPGNGNDHFTPGRNIPLGNIDAMVTLQGSPVARPVFVLNQRGVILRQTHSGANGRYVVEGLEQDQRYIVFALDEPDREYNAAISDYVKPE